MIMTGIGLLGRLVFIAYLSAGESFMAIVPDDAFYYFTIARNIVEGYGSTFDRLAPTNGYHPLWLLVLVPIFLIPIAKLPAALVASDGARYCAWHGAAVWRVG